ncbi:hypothetical protein EGJ86_07490 [Pseudomonas sp. o96-267]|uniref:hypothetical protein n=1 Tax=Pseudomonas sp. o96-267 TaxID=2479853 RepID=UPI000F7A88CD|nr:hypothetical protein [Pseudomonas sp. o96-267]RRV41319.1 hypothetical protein EGJ86_07490 [Pseudomonas sp. o96-267]
MNEEQDWNILNGTVHLPPSSALAVALKDQYERAIRLFLEDVSIAPWPMYKERDFIMDISLDTDDLSNLGLHTQQTLSEMLLDLTRQQMMTATSDGSSPEERRAWAAQTLRHIAAEIENLPLQK